MTASRAALLNEKRRGFSRRFNPGEGWQLGVHLPPSSKLREWTALMDIAYGDIYSCQFI